MPWVQPLSLMLKQNYVLSEVNLSMTEITAEHIEMISAGLALNQAVKLISNTWA
jgi:hypothetical protein